MILKNNNHTNETILKDSGNTFYVSSDVFIKFRKAEW